MAVIIKKVARLIKANSPVARVPEKPAASLKTVTKVREATAQWVWERQMREAPNARLQFAGLFKPATWGSGPEIPEAVTN